MIHRITEFMSEDHDRLHAIFLGFQNSKYIDPNIANKLFYDFKIGLQRHIIWEEEILFNYLEDKKKALKSSASNSNPIALLRMHHTQIKDYLDKIHKKLENMDMDTDQLESWLMELLDEHNIQEEETIYPWIDEELSEREVEEALRELTIFQKKNITNVVNN
ncbi:MAG: hemerythrin domain-containing protein [Candidatus Aenigmarchaeota archaeon]|nr:hemerythrin domain-containing protein [Candidatus Aenigmarchaeota archaeon]